jgi:UDP-N-acetylglucosamine transferase subunit ALG13
MILVTLGTQKQPFNRLLQLIEESKIDDEIIVQAGHTKFESTKMKSFKFIDYDEMENLINEADLVITHGGTGSILTPLKKGKKVIACARLAKYGEHIDNHQQEIVEMFSSLGCIIELKEHDKLDSIYNNIDIFKPKKFVSNTEEFKIKLVEKIEKKD